MVRDCTVLQTNDIEVLIPAWDFVFPSFYDAPDPIKSKNPLKNSVFSVFWQLLSFNFGISPDRVIKIKSARQLSNN